MTVRFDIEVSLALGADITADPSTWSWTDITGYCMVREGGVTITRGRSDWQTSAQPSHCTLLLNNADGRFSRLNPGGAYYGQLSKNTPLRVRACAAGGSLTTRFVGYVSEWPVRWDESESHYWVPVRADGVLRRLGQGTAPIKSLTKSVTQYLAANFPGEVTSYWPLEDAAGSTQAAHGLLTGTPMVASGTVAFAAVTPPAGSAAAPDLSAGSLRGICTSTAETGEWAVTFFVNCTGTCRVLSWTTTGTMTWHVDITTTDVTVTTSDGDTATFSASYADGEWHVITVTAENSGSDVTFGLFGDSDDLDAGLATSATAGRVASVIVNPNVDADLSSVNHIATGSTSGSSITTAHMNGNPGQRAASNFAAIASYNGLIVDYNTDILFETQLMGTFPVGTMLQTMQQCADADEGLLTERLTGLLGFDSHIERENLAVSLALDYDLGHIKAPFEPADDDRLTRNDVTITRTGGSSARVEQTDGPMGTDPETGAGRYDEGLTLNLYDDDQPIHHAGWRVNLGTVNEYRYPTVKNQFHSSSDILTAWLACDIGSRITIDNMPANMPPDLVDQILEGYTERINSVEWDATLNLSPYKPYKIFELADTTSDASEFVGRLAGDDACALRVAVDSDDLSFVFDPNAFRWTEVADDFDPDLKVRLGGEVVEVSTIATTAATFVAAGTAAHASNADVTPGLPAGHTTNDLLLIYAAIRNSGTGVPVAPTGYHIPTDADGNPIFPADSNAQVFAKVHDGSESDPTVTFTGGVANADTSAQMCAFRNMPITLTDLAGIVLSAQTQLNTSAQDIAVPHLPVTPYAGQIVLAFGWKQDDWTSVVSPSGFTEIGEPDTTTGDDQGITWAYRIDTTPAIVRDASFVVTGGASAISRSAVAAIAAGFQTMTVSARSVNGTTKSHAVGTLIEVNDPLVMGL